MNEYERNLQRFSDMEDVEVAENDPDVRGWDVVTTDGRDIGEVKDLLVDTGTMKVRGLEIELEGSHFNWNDNRRVAIPIESVELDEEHDDVVINRMGLGEIGQLQEFRRASAAGNDVRAAAESTRESGRDRLTRSEEELRIGKREVPAGDARIGKHVETEHVSQPVNREKERLRVERRPVSGDVRGATARIGEDEIRVPLTEEELIVEKHPVVKEELVVSKERVEESGSVEADLRKERFDVDDTGRATDDATDRSRRGH